MSRESALWYTGGGLLVLAIVVAAVSNIDPSHSIGDAATVLLVIGAAAVAIERILELVWTGVGLTIGAGWPLGNVSRELKGLASRLDDSLQPIYDEAEAAVAEMKQRGILSGTTLTNAEAALNTLKTASAKLAGMAPDQQQLQMFAASAAQHMEQIQANYAAFLATSGSVGASTVEEIKNVVMALASARARAAARRQGLKSEEIETAVTDAGAKEAERFDRVIQQARDRETGAGADTIPLNPDPDRAALEAAKAYLNSVSPAARLSLYVDLSGTAIQGATDFLATFKDNPGRRLLSIYAGCVLGLVVAGLLGLDVFRAVLDEPAGGATAQVARYASAPGRPEAAAADEHHGIGDWPGSAWDWLREATDFEHIGVALTGLVIGLGSNPTHEVIRVLQEYKKTRKSGNVPSSTTETVEPGASLAGGVFGLLPPVGGSFAPLVRSGALSDAILAVQEVPRSPDRAVAAQLPGVAERPPQVKVVRLR
jgi:hypothetical protein